RRSRFLVINSPSNPTGAAYTKEELAALGKVILRHPKLWVITDDIYDKIVFDDFKFYNLPMVVPELKNRTIVLNGLSKAYSMTGWRLGYAIGDPTIIAAMETIQSQSTSNPVSFVQKGAVVALSGPQDFIGTMVAAFKERRDYVVDQFNSMPGITCRTPEGAFYAYPNCGGLMGKKGPDGKKIKNSLQLAALMLENYGVAVVPGSAFGMDPYFRISYATSMANLEKAMERIRAMAEQLTAA
ncbi:MAG: aminotransferase class I/II-fold pyridoxal phosphate-dependent enzyme, partial [Magnetococcales bacterium]|nr:aminotransferase class I/II-fold pyridoxal phosphate-dependent enzyme [Magnetococcales bacterium]